MELHNLTTDEEIVQNVLESIDNLICEGYSTDEIMVLCKTNGKDYDEIKPTSRHLNKILQERMNPDGEALFTTRDGFIVKKGDRVIALKNHPQDNVYNGYIGKVVGYENFAGEGIDVDFEENGSSYFYKKNEVGRDDGELDLAYTMTVHKSQGSEYPAVIFVFGNTRGYMNFLDRLMLYTAVTRARRRLVLIGSQSVLEDAAENKNVRRNLLRDYLKDLQNQSKKTGKKRRGMT